MGFENERDLRGFENLGGLCLIIVLNKMCDQFFVGVVLMAGAERHYGNETSEVLKTSEVFVLKIVLNKMCDQLFVGVVLMAGIERHHGDETSEVLKTSEVFV